MPAPNAWCLEGLDYLLTQSQRPQPTGSIHLHRPRSRWAAGTTQLVYTRSDSASDSIIGQAIPLETLGREDITTSGLRYDNQGNPTFLKNNQGQLQWEEMQNDLNAALNRLAELSTDPTAMIQVNAYGLNSAGNTTLNATYQDLFSNQIFDNSASRWSYSNQTINSIQDFNF